MRFNRPDLVEDYLTKYHGYTLEQTKEIAAAWLTSDTVNYYYDVLVGEIYKLENGNLERMYEYFDERLREEEDEENEQLKEIVD